MKLYPLRVSKNGVGSGTSYSRLMKNREYQTKELNRAKKEIVKNPQSVSLAVLATMESVERF